jgi:hypothetical protein
MIVDKDGNVFPLEFNDKPGYPIENDLHRHGGKFYSFSAKSFANVMKNNPLLDALLKRALVDKDGKPFPKEPSVYEWDVYDGSYVPLYEELK